jgi:hypothetical protein
MSETQVEQQQQQQPQPTDQQKVETKPVVEKKIVGEYILKNY